MSQIVPFDPSANPLREVDENPHLVREYVRDHKLLLAAEEAWNRLKDSPNIRRSLLVHLCDQIVADNSTPPLKPLRFIELRNRGLLDAYGDSETFADLVSLEDWAGVEWIELQLYVALYAEPQGEHGPYFSSQTFFLHYLEAHGLPLPD